MSHTPILLIIDDEQAILTTLKTALEDESYQVETLSDGRKALDVIGKLIPDLIFLDICMPNCNGLDLLLQIKKEHPHQKIIIISGYGNIPTALKAIKFGAIDFIEKPFNLDDILDKIEFLKQEYTDAQSKTLNHVHAENLIGESFLFCELSEQARKIAKSPLIVLISGEPGSGKSTFAKFIHQQSLLEKNSFSIIDCNVTKENHFVSQIEDLSKSKNPITIYIKHIELLSKDNQRAASVAIEANHKHRFIVSTNSSLFRLTTTKKFDPKLFHLINVIPLEIPPLRKRRYDIPLLINHFLKQSDPKKSLTTKGIRILRNQIWPGNVVELKNVLLRLTTQHQSQNNTIPTSEVIEVIDNKESSLIDEQTFSRFRSLSSAKNEFEKNFILHLLKKNLYNLSQVSDQIELSIPNLKNKLLELDIKVPKGV
jgi:two-component system, NtrC family, nitrogen regulation response regulator NtrX